MRNLKRALSLALAAIMLIGMMVVSASAASYNDLTDKDQIVNKDAVSMLVTLGVIEGKPDGSYAPTEGVDRAQMAKMISVIMNQGVDNGALYENSPSGLTDISSHWAKGHINYCYTTGIIAGRGNGKFDPDAGVTGSEAAKMLLVAAGYDPAIEGLTGTDWEINTNALASKLGIFRNFKGSVAEPLSRDNAALLIYNALDVEMIESYTNNGYAMAYSDARTILSSMYGVYKVEGVVVGNKWAELDKTDSDSALKDGKTVLDNVVLYSSTTSNTTKDEGVAQSGKIAFNVDTPVDFLGKTVTMYIEKTTILSDSKVLGVSTKDDVNVINATAATQSTVKDYLKGTGVAVTKDTEFYVNYGYCKTEEDAHNLINDYSYAANNSDKFNLNGVDVEIIDNNNDGDAEYVLFTRETLSEVRTYSEKNETISFYAPGYDKNNELANKTVTETEDFEDVVFNDEVTTDDLILYVQYGGRTYISAPEVVTGKMTRVDRDKADELFITVDGEE
ncbi:S-layer homology domain-containing protein, partial [Flavonifractor plautii]